MPYLESLRVFVRVVELGSITAGGRDLRMSPAVASNRIKDLETRYGVRLLNRTTRKLSLTEAGEAYYREVSQILSQLDDLDATIAEQTAAPRGILRVPGRPRRGVLHGSRYCLRGDERHAETEDAGRWRPCPPAPPRRQGASGRDGRVRYLA